MEKENPTNKSKEPQATAPAERPDQDLLDIWPNCTVADCSNKACLGLSNEVCFPHYFRLPMDSRGNAIYPDEETKNRLQGILHEALERFRNE